MNFFNGLNLSTLFVSFAGAVFVYGLAIAVVIPARPLQPSAQKSGAEILQPITLDPQALGAKAAVVYDPQSGRVLFAKNPYLSLPLASLTKLMTAQVVLDHASAATPVTMTAQDLAVISDQGDIGFRAGDTFLLGELVRYGIVASSNNAMAAAAGALGDAYVGDMNRTAGRLGLAQTYFLNPTGLDLDLNTSGAYGSALDVAKLTAAFFKQYPDYFELTQQKNISITAHGRVLTTSATTVPLQELPGFVGAKTGYTDLAGGNVAAVFDIEIGHPLVIVILGSTEKGRFDDIKTLIAAARKNI